MMAGLGRLQAFGAVLHVVALTRAKSDPELRSGGIWRGDLAAGAGF